MNLGIYIGSFNPPHIGHIDVVNYLEVNPSGLTNSAKASATVYSLVETAKANRLKPYEYLNHLLTEIPKYMADPDASFLDDLLPWSDAIPNECRKEPRTETAQ